MEIINSSLSSLLHLPVTYHTPLRPKHTPHHTTLKNPQPMFLPQHKKPRSTPTQNRPNYSSLYLTPHIFG